MVLDLVAIAVAAAHPVAASLLGKAAASGALYAGKAVLKRSGKKSTDKTTTVHDKRPEINYHDGRTTVYDDHSQVYNIFIQNNGVSRDVLLPLVAAIIIQACYILLPSAIVFATSAAAIGLGSTKSTSNAVLIPGVVALSSLASASSLAVTNAAQSSLASANAFLDAHPYEIAVATAQLFARTSVLWFVAVFATLTFSAGILESNNRFRGSLYAALLSLGAFCMFVLLPWKIVGGGWSALTVMLVILPAYVWRNGYGNKSLYFRLCDALWEWEGYGPEYHPFFSGLICCSIAVAHVWFAQGLLNIGRLLDWRMYMWLKFVCGGSIAAMCWMP